MKKLIYTICMALMWGIASAIVPTAGLKSQSQPVNISQIQNAPKKYVKIGDDGKRKVNGDRKGLPTSVEAYLGSWKWEGINGLNNVIIPNEGEMSIERMEGTDSLLIRHFDQLADMGKGGLRGIFKNGRIYIPNQISCYEGNDVISGGVPTIFCNYTLRNMTPQEKEEWEAANPGQSAEGFGYFEKAPEGVWFFLALVEDGEDSYLTSVYYEYPDEPRTDEVLQQSWSAAAEKDLSLADTGEGYYWLCSHVRGDAVKLFSFNPEEWTYIGMAKFQDAWMRYAFSELPAGFDEYEVEAYRSKIDDNRYLLLDPYGPNTPWGEYEINISNRPGYLVFDILAPDCVIFEPYVYSMTYDIGDGTTPDLQKLYFYNLEGFYNLMGGYDIDEIIYRMDRDGIDISYFDNQTNKVWIYNGIFNIIPMGNFESYFTWANGAMEGYVILPEGYDDVPQVPSMYVIGDNVNGQSWVLGQPDGRMKMTSLGIYEWSGSVLGSSFKINNGTWDDPDFNIGAANGGEITLDIPCPYLTGWDNGNFLFEGFDYLINPHIVLDTNSQTITVSGTPEINVVTYYIIGENVNGRNWELAQYDAAFTQIEDGLYVWSGKILGKEFKINDGTWDNVKGGAYNIGSRNDETIRMNTPYAYYANESSGNIAFANFGLLLNPVVYLNVNEGTITLVDGQTYVEGTSESFYPEYLYIVSGNVNGFDMTVPDESCRLESVADGLYQWEGTSLGSFLLTDGTGNPLYNLGSSGKALALDNPYDYAAGLALSPIEIQGRETVEQPQLTVDLLNWKVILSSKTDGVKVTEKEEDSQATYYDVHGFRVEKPEAGNIYIKVSAGNAEKVIM